MKRHTWLRKCPCASPAMRSQARRSSIPSHSQDVSRPDRYLLRGPFGDLHCRMPEQVADFAFEVAPGFTDLVADRGRHNRIADPALSAAQAADAKLAANQQEARHRVRRTDEHHFRQIERLAEVIVTEAGVLFRSSTSSSAAAISMRPAVTHGRSRIHSAGNTGGLKVRSRNGQSLSEIQETPRPNLRHFHQVKTEAALPTHMQAACKTPPHGRMPFPGEAAAAANARSFRERKTRWTT